LPQLRQRRRNQPAVQRRIVIAADPQSLDLCMLHQLVCMIATFVVLAMFSLDAAAQVEQPVQSAISGPQTWQPYDNRTIGLQVATGVATAALWSGASYGLYRQGWGGSNLWDYLFVSTAYSMPYLVPAAVNFTGVHMGGTPNYAGALAGSFIATGATYWLSFALAHGGYDAPWAFPLPIVGGSILGYHLAASKKDLRSFANPTPPGDHATIGVQFLAGLTTFGLCLVPLEFALTQGYSSFTGDVFIAGLILSPFVMSLGVNATGVMMGGTSHYLGTLVGSLIGLAISFPLAWTLDAEPLWMSVPLAFIGGAITGYHVASSHRGGNIASVIRISPVVDSQGRMGGATVGMNMEF
jgi:hypothetical protein